MDTILSSLVHITYFTLGFALGSLTRYVYENSERLSLLEKDREDDEKDEPIPNLEKAIPELTVTSASEEQNPTTINSSTRNDDKSSEEENLEDSVPNIFEIPKLKESSEAEEVSKRIAEDMTSLFHQLQREETERNEKFLSKIKSMKVRPVISPFSSNGGYLTNRQLESHNDFPKLTTEEIAHLKSIFTFVVYGSFYEAREKVDKMGFFIKIHRVNDGVVRANFNDIYDPKVMYVNIIDENYDYVAQAPSFEAYIEDIVSFGEV